MKTRFHNICYMHLPRFILSYRVVKFFSRGIHKKDLHVTPIAVFVIPSFVLLMLIGFPVIYRITASEDAMNKGAYQFEIKTKNFPELLPHTHEPALDRLYDTGHGVSVISDAYIATEDLWIIGLEWEVENAPLAVLHHSLLQRFDELDMVCPMFYQELVTGAVDANYAPFKFPAPYGMFVAAGTPLALHGILHNPVPPYGPGEFYKNVVIVLRVDVEPARISKRSRNIEYQRLRIDESPCEYSLAVRKALSEPVETRDMVFVSDETFSVPVGSKHAKFKGVDGRDFHTGELQFQSDGILLGYGGHVHGWDGGENLSVYLNGELLSKLVSRQTGSDRWMWETSREWLYRRVNAGDIISIEATYSNPYTKPLIGAAMGMLGMFYSPDE